MLGVVLGDAQEGLVLRRRRRKRYSGGVVVFVDAARIGNKMLFEGQISCSGRRKKCSLKTRFLCHGTRSVVGPGTGTWQSTRLTSGPLKRGAAALALQLLAAVIAGRLQQVRGLTTPMGRRGNDPCAVPVVILSFCALLKFWKTDPTVRWPGSSDQFKRHLRNTQGTSSQRAPSLTILKPSTMPVLRPLSGNPDAPQQHKQPSRKGKKAWRKNVDISEVQHGLEELNDQIIKGYVLLECSVEAIC